MIVNENTFLSIFIFNLQFEQKIRKSGKIWQHIQNGFFVYSHGKKNASRIE